MNIPAPHGHLEAVHREPPGTLRGAGVVGHPHPLMGGTMHTKAVFRAAQTDRCAIAKSDHFLVPDGMDLGLRLQTLYLRPGSY